MPSVSWEYLIDQAAKRGTVKEELAVLLAQYADNQDARVDQLKRELEEMVKDADSLDEQTPALKILHRFKELERAIGGDPDAIKLADHLRAAQS
jgi:type II secretory pathway predicted ATPase ExeA